MKTMVNYLDLFSGIGGFAYGAYMAGFKCDNHFFSEVEPYAIKLYQLRFPDAINLENITEIDFEKLKREYPGEWVITGGFPCQDISIAGKGVGLDGKRSGLWFEMFRAIRILRPKYVIAENVSAITFRGLDRVISSLAEIRYDVEWQDIRASDVGAPHRRERIWIISYPRHNAGSPELRIKRKISSKKSIGLRSRKLAPGNDLADTGCKLRNEGNTNRVEADKAEWSSSELHDQSSGPGPRKISDTNSSDSGRGTDVENPGNKRRKSSGARREGIQSENQETCTNNIESSSENVADTKSIHAQRFSSRQREGEFGRNSRWEVEPAVGGRFNGLSRELDIPRYLIYLSHKCIMAYGQIKKKRTKKILSALRSCFNSQDDKWAFRGLWSVSSQEILFSLLCELEKDPKMQEYILSKSEKAFEKELRELRMEFFITRTSQRPKLYEQCTGEYTDSMQALSRFLAHYCQKAWERHCRENARNISWECGISRTSVKLLNRVDRLKGLGNSIVPQIAKMLFELCEKNIC